MKGELRKMTKKPYKIVKSDLFKQQEKNLPKPLRKELDKVLKSITKNPTKAQCSMNLFGKPSPEELKQWMGRVSINTIDLMFEYLYTKSCLSITGKKLSEGFLDKYVNTDKK